MIFPRRLQQILRAVMPPVLGLVAILFVAFFHFQKHYDANRLTSNSLDTVQAARYFARTGEFGTEVIRPLISAFTPFLQDGSQPDLGHSPLYTLLAGTAIRLLHETGAGQGDRGAVLVALAGWVAGVVAVFLLTRTLFKSNGIAALAGSLYAFGSGSGVQLALTPHPATIAAALYIVLLFALVQIDRRENDEPLSARDGLLYSALAGASYGLLFLSVYSALIFFPLILARLWQTTTRAQRLRILPMFVLTAVLVAMPHFLRTYHVTRNPFFHARALEFIMQTETYPGYTLYHSAALTQSFGQYLSGGGYAEVTRKTFVNIVGYFERLPTSLGVVLTPLYFCSALIRFDDARVNRLRNFVFIALVVHMIGLSPFQPERENIPLILLHQAAAAVLAAGFLSTVIRARNLPVFFNRAAFIAWGFFGCLPGGLLYVAGLTGVTPPPFEIYAALNNSSVSSYARVAPVRMRRAGLVSESPWEFAYRCDLPTIWLPRDAADFSLMEQRSGRPIATVILTPALLSDYIGDTASVSWQTTYLRLGALWSVAGPLDTATRTTLISKVKLYYPTDISPALSGYQPEPIAERDGREYTFLFWNPTLKPMVPIK